MLLDHNLDKALARDLSSHSVTLTKNLGWEGLSNGPLLTVAQAAFDVLLTTDVALYSQQKVEQFTLGVIVLRVFSNRYEDCQPVVPEVLQVLEEIKPGQLRFVYVSPVLEQSDRRRKRGPYATNRAAGKKG